VTDGKKRTQVESTIIVTESSSQSSSRIERPSGLLLEGDEEEPLITTPFLHLPYLFSIEEVGSFFIATSRNTQM
jgi:hypothetical protein